MSNWCRPWLFLVVLVPAAIPQATPAQEAPNSSTRRPYGSDLPPGDLEQMLKDDFQRLKDMETLRDLAEQFGKASKLLQKFKGMIDPEMQERLEKRAGDFENDP